MNAQHNHVAARTRIKICGITRSEDAMATARAGADAIGLVFTPRSKRHVSIEQALTVCEVLPPFITKVALFMDQERDEVQRILDQVPIDYLQFHGAETPDFCQQFQRPFLKALAMGGVSAQEVAQQLPAWSKASALLFDAHTAGESGGKGEVFDWSLLPQASPLPTILAGGLSPANVAEAVRSIRPFAVDVSSGVETSPGLKDPILLQQFVEEVRRGDIA